MTEKLTERQKQAIEMYQGTATIKEICDATYYTVTGLYTMLRRKGIPVRSQGNYSLEAVALAKWADISQMEANRLLNAYSGGMVTVDHLRKARLDIDKYSRLCQAMPVGHYFLLFPFPVVVTHNDQFPLTWLDTVQALLNPLKWIQENIKAPAREI